MSVLDSVLCGGSEITSVQLDFSPLTFTHLMLCSRVLMFMVQNESGIHWFVFLLLQLWGVAGGVASTGLTPDPNQTHLQSLYLATCQEPGAG